MDVSASAQVTCLCGDVREDGSLIGELLPRDAALCHSDACRTITGALTYAGVTLRQAPSDASLGRCVMYAASDRVLRYFCKRCGTHCFYRFPQKDIWRACSGAVEQSPESKRRGDPWPENILRVTSHIFVGDTIDNRLPRWWKQLGGREVHCYAEGFDSPPMAESALDAPAQATVHESNNTLQAKCHCGTVDLQILRPEWDASKTPLYIPPDPQDKDKYVAGMCACRSCRLAFGGSSLAHWTYVPEQRVLYHGKPVEFSNQGNNIAGAIHYVNGEVVRSSCGTCGATIFYWCQDRREVVDIAVGLLRAPEGAAAGNWLWWRGPISWKEEAADKEIVDAYLSRTT